MIESKDNLVFKNLKKLHQKKYRDQTNTFLVYGEHLIECALRSDCVKEIFTQNPKRFGTLMSAKLMKELSQTQTTFDRVALCIKKENKQSDNKILALDNVQDPDNVGALLRSASAFGFNKVILNQECADVYNDKVIRASQGALFDLEIIRCDLYDYLSQLDGFYIMAATTQGSQVINKMDRIVLVVGNEGKGVSEAILSLADANVTIKTKNVESLNVVVAASILMYELS